jgi:flavin-dependent dehydrogenase
MNPIYDIAIVGGGPAGSAAAITAARYGVRVLLLERGDFPRQKVCGEFVSAESLELLSELLGDSRILASAPPLRSVRICIDGQEAEQRITPPARALTRLEMDRLLWEQAAASGADSRTGVTVRRVTRTSEGFTLETSSGSFAARAMINATGRWSELSRTRPSLDRWIGIKAHFSGATINDAVELHFAGADYCGLQPIGGGHINVCAMLRPHGGTTFQAIFERFPELARRSRDWHQIGAIVRTSPLFFRSAEPVHDDILQCGDAAAFVDPFAGDGISLALQSGKLAAQTLLPLVSEAGTLVDCARAYESEYKGRFGRVFSSAARIRRTIEAPQLVRWAAMQLFRLPAVSAAVMAATRAKAIG